jgi:nitrate/nitrite transporter NarK
MSKDSTSKGKIVITAGTGINLALGILYTWSIFKVAIKQSIETGGTGEFNWNPASLNDPYAVCCLVFACMMIIAGKCQDLFGPRITAFTGGILVGTGFIIISQTTSYYMWILGFGILVGTGIAFGYSSATPPALKWYPPVKTGKIAGIVVSGFGLASVYIAPLSQYLLSHWGIQGTMLFFGIAFFIVVSLLSQLLVNPPEGYVPGGVVERRSNAEANLKARASFEDINYTPQEMMRTYSFWMLWILYFIGAGAGLMVIGSVAGMAKSSMGANAFLAVAIMALGNAGGRIAAGILSDKIGRTRTLASIFILQALMMFIAVPVVGAKSPGAASLVFLATFIGFNYGANLALFPSFTKDFWGIKNFGVNYGLIFTAWGFGGFVMSKASQILLAGTNTFTSSFIAAGVLLCIGAILTYFIKDRKEIARHGLAQQAATRSSCKQSSFASNASKQDVSLDL